MRSHRVTINRIEATAAKHILVVCIVLDGSNTTELVYRIQEAKFLAGYITQARMSQVDARIVYRKRWMASIQY